MDTLFLAVSDKLIASQQWMALNLEDGWNYVCSFDESFDLSFQISDLPLARHIVFRSYVRCSVI